MKSIKINSGYCQHICNLFNIDIKYAKHFNFTKILNLSCVFKILNTEDFYKFLITKSYIINYKIPYLENYENLCLVESNEQYIKELYIKPLEINANSEYNAKLLNTYKIFDKKNKKIKIIKINNLPLINILNFLYVKNNFIPTFINYGYNFKTFINYIPDFFKNDIYNISHNFLDLIKIMNNHNNEADNQKIDKDTKTILNKYFENNVFFHSIIFVINAENYLQILNHNNTYIANLKDIISFQVDNYKNMDFKNNIQEIYNSVSLNNKCDYEKEFNRIIWKDKK